MTPADLANSTADILELVGILVAFVGLGVALILTGEALSDRRHLTASGLNGELALVAQNNLRRELLRDLKQLILLALMWTLHSIVPPHQGQGATAILLVEGLGISVVLIILIESLADLQERKRFATMAADKIKQGGKE